MWNHNLTLLVIMLLAGGFGGTVNHLLDKRGKREGHSLLRSIFIGTAASLLVPLFLNMISSTLLAQSAVDDEKLFVFSGFCIIAAISSSAFIRRISAKVLQEVQVLQKNVQDTRAGLDLLLDVHMEPEYKRGSSPATTNALPLAESAIAVLRCTHRREIRIEVGGGNICVTPGWASTRSRPISTSLRRWDLSVDGMGTTARGGLRPRADLENFFDGRIAACVLPTTEDGRDSNGPTGLSLSVGYVIEGRSSMTPNLAGNDELLTSIRMMI